MSTLTRWKKLLLLLLFLTTGIQFTGNEKYAMQYKKVQTSSWNEPYSSSSSFTKVMQSDGIVILLSLIHI